MDEIVVEIVGAELIKDQEYGSMGMNLVDRVKHYEGNLISWSVTKKGDMMSVKR